MSAENRNYEMVLVFQDSGEEELNRYQTQLNTDLEKRNITVKSSEEWGNRNLFHETNHHTRGKFYFYNITANPANIAQITSDINVNAGIIKSLVTRAG
ncbi:MAG: 30S ribosomal protein S6 [Leptospiraceae bacterium]|nr:30S ribosomal protein S6 [Leptospiraceae bacterium]MCB1199794.1 30S ribosomal protein S6 [Leptospiraceae bacterium]